MQRRQVLSIDTSRDTDTFSGSLCNVVERGGRACVIEKAPEQVGVQAWWLWSKRIIIRPRLKEICENVELRCLRTWYQSQAIIQGH